MGHVILFEHNSFHGAHKHVFDYEPNLNASDDSSFNDRVSSLVVDDDEWAFFRNAGYVGQYASRLGPGKYRSVASMDIQNDDMSSLRMVGSSASLVTAHAILFEHANFHGAHKHVFGSEPNLNAADDNYFNDKVSSIIVLSGVWNFYRNSGYVGRYSAALNPGAYAWVGNVDIQNDDMSSLGPRDTSGVAKLPHVILFEHANLHGRHRHVFGAEPNLNAGDDNYFNDKVSSLVVVSGEWAFYRNANYNGQYAATLGPGIYRWVGGLDIQNDDMSSLRPV
jgi:hypothetical protein